MAELTEKSGDTGIMRKSMPRLFIKRMTILSLGFSIIILFFYVVGNFQNFLDKTQLLLLSLLSWTSLFSFFFSLIGIIVLSASRRTETKPRRVLGFSGYCAGALLAVCLIAIAYFLRAIFIK
jgi:hypothetical protein